jgi:UDP-N-acetylmuramoylalanine--D-glutamate ligase
VDAALAEQLAAAGVELVDPREWGSAVAAADLVVPSPGVPPRHPAIATAREEGVPIRAEIDLAAERARSPFAAITGTNGKSTVTTLVAAMLTTSGLRAEAVGNLGRPFLDAVDDDVDALAVEVSSFQLAFTTPTFRPRVAVLLEIAPDHLDWHGGLDAYVAAKRRVYEAQGDGDLLVVVDDGQGAAARAPDPATTVVVGEDHDVRRDGDRLLDADGTELASTRDMTRALPHDVTNALAAAAAARHLGATIAGIRAALRDFRGLPHRVALVGDAGGVQWYDDSKATNPHAVLHAVRSFDSVVLLAGGRNKGLDLRTLAETAEHVRAVIAFGEAADEVADAFRGVRPVERAASMREAVELAAAHAQPGDAVLLSPGCASFDAYGSYAERGDDFASEVRAHIAPGVGA